MDDDGLTKRLELFLEQRKDQLRIFDEADQALDAKMTTLLQTSGVLCGLALVGIGGDGSAARLNALPLTLAAVAVLMLGLMVVLIIQEWKPRNFEIPGTPSYLDGSTDEPDLKETMYQRYLGPETPKALGTLVADYIQAAAFMRDRSIEKAGKVSICAWMLAGQSLVLALAFIFRFA